MTRRVAVALFALSVCVFGLARPAAAQGVITGAVKNGSGVTLNTTIAPGDGIPGVTVKVYNGDNLVAQTQTTGGGPTGGTYLFNGLNTANSYRVVTDASQTLVPQNAGNPAFLVDQVYKNPGPNVECGGCQMSTSGGTTLAGTSSWPNINFSLRQGPHIAGVITDNATNPLNMINVQITVMAQNWATTMSATSNLSGNYLGWSGLPPGNYAVRTSNLQNYVDRIYNGIACVGGICSPTTGTPITVTGAMTVATTLTANFALPQGGTISGTVTDTMPTPIDGAQVTVFNSAGNTVGFTNSGFDGVNHGVYKTPGLPTGSYYVKVQTFSGPSLIPDLYDSIPCVGCAVTTGTPVSVTAGSNTPNINFTMLPADTITGTVRDGSNNSTISGVSVQIFNSAGTFVTASPLTGANGVYTVGGLADGTYYVKALGPNGGPYLNRLYLSGSDAGNDTAGIDCPNCDVTTGGSVQTLQGTLTGIDLHLTVGGTITGSVKDTTPVAISGMTVTLLNSSGGQVGTAVSAPSGNFTFQGLQGGSYYVRTNTSTSSALNYIPEIFAGLGNHVVCLGCNVSSGTSIPVSLGATTSGINFNLNAGGEISGTVSNGVSGISGVTVQIFNGANASVASAPTNGTGGYTVFGLPAGTYFAKTSNTLGYIDQAFNNLPCVGCNATGGTPIVIPIGLTPQSASFTLSQGGRISGTVTDQTSAPLSGVGVQVFTSGGTSVGGTAFTNGAGAFTTSVGLPTGNYFVVTSNNLGYINTLYNGISCFNCPATSGTPVPVTAPSTTPNINMVLQTGGSITGKVQQPFNGETSPPIANVFVQVYSSGGAFLSSIGTNALGLFTLTGLPTGSYLLRTSNTLGFVDQLYTVPGGTPCLSCDVTTGTPISVTAGATTALNDITLVQGGGITGVVLDANSVAAIQGITVQAFTSAGLFAGSATTQPNGVYTIKGLIDGSYFVRTFNSIGYINLLHQASPPDTVCGSCVTTQGAPVVVAGGEITQGIGFLMSLGGTIKGTITDGSSNGILNVTVNAVTPGTGVSVASGFTDSSGNYAISGIVPGTYLIKTSNSAGFIDQIYNVPNGELDCVNCAATNGQTITITTSGQIVPNINFTLNAGGRIRGHVHDTNSNALSNISVQVSTSTGRFITSSSSGPDGSWVSGAGLPPGDYVVRTSNNQGYTDQLYNGITCVGCVVNTGTIVTIPSIGATVGGIDFALAVGGAISGTVTDALSAPIQGVTVQVYTSGGSSISATSTNGSGAFVLRGLPTGSYFVKTFNTLGYIDQLWVTPNPVSCINCTVTTGSPIAVTVGATTTGVNFALTAGGRVGGTVTIFGGGPPIAGMTVQVYNSAGQFVTSGTSSPSGTYLTPGLAAGTYFVKTQNNLGYVNLLHASPNDIFCNTCSVTSGTSVSVSLGATTTVDFGMSTGGAIKGRVTDASNNNPSTNGISGVPIQVYTASSAGATFAASGTTAFDGTYTVGGLTGGAYTVRTQNSAGFIDQQYNNQVCVFCVPTTGTPVLISGTSTVSGIDFNLNRGGSVMGTITDASSNAPLQNVTVSIFDPSGSLITSGTTDNRGIYTTRGGIPDGTYYARTNNTIGYINETWPSNTCLNCPVTVGTPFTIANASTVSPVNFALSTGGRITGTITDASTGNPLSGITVMVLLADGTPIGASVTNSAGGYSTTGLPGGTYFIRTQNGFGYVNRLYDTIDCMRCAVATGRPVTVVAGAVTPGINIALSIGGRISGRIIDATSSFGIASATVTVYDASNTSVGAAITDANGNYLSTVGLIPGTYYVKTANQFGYINQVYNGTLCLACNATTGTPIPVAGGTTTPNINFALSPGGRISGQVSVSSAGVPDVEVDIFSSGGTFLTSAITGSGGQYVTGEGLPPGSYYLVTDNDAGLIDQLYDGNECGFTCAVTTGTAVPVIGTGTTANVNFNLRAGGRISGVVTDHATGLPLPNVAVDIYNSTGAILAEGFTDGTGTYTTFEGLAPGTYYAVTSINSTVNQRVNKLYSGIVCPACDPTTGTSIVIPSPLSATPPTIPNINFALDLGSVISGTVTDASSGKPVSGAKVNVYDANGLAVASGMTVDNGSYIITTGLPAGNYYARTSNGLGYVDVLYNTGVCLACDVTRGTAIAVDGATPVGGINFSLTAGGRITGTVTASQDGSPVAGSKIRVFNSSGSFLGQVFTNGIGNYITFGLPPGSYYVRTANLSKLIDELYDNVPCTPCDVSAGSLVTVVTAGLKTGIDFALDAGGLVSGFITDQATGSPIRGVTISVFRSSDGVKIATTDPTDSNGYYQISLPIGNYQFEVNPIAGFRPVLGSGLRAAARTTVVVDTGTETTGVGFQLVACTPLTISPSSLPLATSGQPYSIQLAASGGTGPYTFSVSNGSTNIGLTLAANGLISGTPAASGTGNFTAAALDTATSCGGSQVFALTACSFFLSTNLKSTTSAAGGGSVSLTGSSADCPWAAVSNASWITVTSAASGTGNATVTFSYAANTGNASRTGTILIGGQTFSVTQAGLVSSPPFGFLETPADGATGLSGSVAVTGWALDDVEVKRVIISRSPVAGEGSSDIFIGDAVTLEGARPDVAAAFPNVPFNTHAGFGYLLLSNMLPNQGNGTFVLHADAVDAEGNTTRLGSKSVTFNNGASIKPFGSIDTPAQGESISGTSYINFGWAVTPQPKTIPTDGSTVTVFFDGAPVSNVDYNHFRPDIATLFPGLANSNGAVGFYVFDTTSLTNGTHSIFWIVTDDGGITEGIGSRYFTVNNTLASLRAQPPAAVFAPKMFSALSGVAALPPVQFSTALSNGVLLELTPDGDGHRAVPMGQLDRLTLKLNNVCGGVTGRQVTDGGQQPLPIGSTLDPSGTYYWHPGPAFLGTYHLEFAVPVCGAGTVTVPVDVAIIGR